MRFSVSPGCTMYVRPAPAAEAAAGRANPQHRLTPGQEQPARTARNPITHFRGRHGRCRTSGAQIGRIKQEGVFTNQAPGRPVQFNQHIHEGLVDRTIARDPHHGPASPPLNGHAQSADRRREIDAGLPEGFGRGEARRHVLEFFRRGGYSTSARRGCPSPLRTVMRPRPAALRPEDRAPMDAAIRVRLSRLFTRFLCTKACRRNRVADEHNIMGLVRQVQAMFELASHPPP
jgi:hypothetical protein